MKIRMSRMYVDGVETSKREFLARYDYQAKGSLSISDTSNQGAHKVLKIARFDSIHEKIEAAFLYDPLLTWVNEERMVLSGFERKLVGTNTVRFAQSWLCRIGWEDVPAQLKT